MNPLVYVIIPNYNGRNHLEYSLQSLIRTTYPTYQVVLVDDCSNDDSLEFVTVNFPQVDVLRNSVNSGFAASVNRGIVWALEKEAEYVAIFNSDIKVLPGWLEPILEFFKNQENTGVIGFTEHPRMSKDQFAMPSTIEIHHVGTKLPGMLYVCRSDIFEIVGFYDEKYFMYGEESDLFARIERSGHQVLQSSIPVWHFVGGAGQKIRLRIAWLSYRNGIRFVVKNGSIVDVLLQITALLYYAAVPVLRPAGNNSVIRWFSRGTLSEYSEDDIEGFRVQLHRFRLGHPLANICLWFGAVLWNLIFLPWTLIDRFEDSKRMRKGQ